MRTGHSREGVVDYEPCELTDNTKRRIRDGFKRDGVQLNSCEESFFKELSVAISLYKADKEIRERSKPGDDKKRLKKLLKSARSLRAALTELDGHSENLVRRLLREVIELEEFEQRYIDALIQVAEEATERTRDWPTGGRPPATENDFLDWEIIKIYDRFTDHCPSTLKEGPFEHFFTTIIEEATGVEPRSPNDRICRQVPEYKSWKESREK